MTHATHKKWLKVTSIVIGSFGPVFTLGTMAKTSEPARLTLDLLSWPIDGATTFTHPDTHFLSALTGGFLCGSGVTVWCLATVHGKWDAAILSAPARAFIPFAVGLAGIGVSCRGHTPGAMDDDCAGRGLLGGMVVGAIATSALEAWLVSYEKTPVKPAVTPTASITSNGATFGLAGIF